MASGNPETILSAAAAFAEKGQFDEAEGLCADVLRGWGNSAGAYNQLGVIRYAQNRLPEAGTYFRTAYALDEENADAAKNLADVLLESGNAREALRIYRILNRRFPEDPEIAREVAAAERRLRGRSTSGDRNVELQVAESRMPPLAIPDLTPLENRKSGMSGHLLFLFNLARETGAKHVVEIGLGGGNSSMAFLLALKETGGILTSIDVQECEDARHYIGMLPATANWRFLRLRSDDAVASIRTSDPIDVLLIDGFHSYGQCRSDYFNFAPLVRRGGYILFHDSSTIQGVTEFTAELLDRGLGGTNLDYCNGLFVFHKQTEVIW